MRVAYFDCFAGISGDMTLGALVDAGVDFDRLKRGLAALPVEAYELTRERVVKNGIAATSVNVQAEETSAPRTLSNIVELLARSGLPPRVKERSQRAFERLAEAEARVHGTTPEQIHFHEVGAVDALVDIVGAMIGLEELGVDRIYASRLPTSYGTVRCAHGLLPVPAPATMELLKNVPTVPSGLEGELVTPTGAAILTTVADHFGDMPPFTVERVAYGAGQKDLEIPNVLRLVVGTSEEEERTETLTVLETNLDDMNPEFYDHVLDRLFQAGAADVYLCPIQMKKNRPAVLLSVLAHPGDLPRLKEILFAETSTLGVRWYNVRRHCLERENFMVPTRFGEVSVKLGRRGGVLLNLAPEYESCRAAARRCNVPLAEVYEEARQAARQWCANASGPDLGPGEESEEAEISPALQRTDPERLEACHDRS